MPNVDPIRIEQQYRRKHAGTLSLDQPEQQVECFLQRPAARDQFQNPVLAFQQFRAFLGSAFGTLTLCNFMEEDRESFGGGIDPVFEPTIPRLVIILHLDERLLGHGFLVSMMERLSYPFRKLRPDVLSNKFLRRTAEDLGGLPVDVRVVPV